RRAMPGGGIYQPAPRAGFDRGAEGRRIGPHRREAVHFGEELPVARSPRDDRFGSSRPSARWTEKTAPHIVALRGRPGPRLGMPAGEPFIELSEPAAGRITISLQTKILVSYVILGAALLFAVPQLLERIRNPFAAGAVVLLLTLIIGWGLTWLLAR